MITRTNHVGMGAFAAFVLAGGVAAAQSGEPTDAALETCTLSPELCETLVAEEAEAAAAVEEVAELDPAQSRIPERFQVDEDARGYRAFLMRELEYIGTLDLYGVSAQLPEGWLKFSWDYGWLTADSRFDSHGNRGPVIAPIQFELGGETQLDVDLDVSGKGHGHTFQISYGITNPLDFYIEIPVTAMDLNLNPVTRPIDDEGNTIGPTAANILGVSDRQAYNASNFIYESFPTFGRPAPATGFDGDWLLGDINAGFSWNIFRSHRFSTAWTNRVFFPTGHVPAPESNITYATGPQPEIGIGGWGASTTCGYDLRLYKHSYWVDIILSTEIGFGYFFKQERDYPSNFTQPSALVTESPELSGMFPDLSNLDGTFEYTPGFNTSWTAQLNIAVALLNIGVAYGWAHSQKPELQADPAFVQMVDGLELLGQQSRSEVQIGVSTTLLPLYIPASIGIARRIMVDGRDTLAFSNFWQFSLETFAPLSMLWDKDRRRGPPDHD